MVVPQAARESTRTNKQVIKVSWCLDIPSSFLKAYEISVITEIRFLNNISCHEMSYHLHCHLPFRLAFWQSVKVWCSEVLQGSRANVSGLSVGPSNRPCQDKSCVKPSVIILIVVWLKYYVPARFNRSGPGDVWNYHYNSYPRTLGKESHNFVFFNV